MDEGDRALALPSSLAGSSSVSDRRAAVAEWMREYGDAVLGFCIRVLSDRGRAEDVVQQVFLEAYRDFGRFQQRSSPLAWLFGIASHRCLDAVRKQQRYSKWIENNEEAVSGSHAPGAEVIDHLDREQRTTALEDCLQRLSSEIRMTVLMRFQTGLTYEEMALSLGTKADALQMRVSRALLKLRQCMESKGWTDE